MKVGNGFKPFPTKLGSSMIERRLKPAATNLGRRLE